MVTELSQGEAMGALFIIVVLIIAGVVYGAVLKSRGEDAPFASGCLASFLAGMVGTYVACAFAVLIVLIATAVGI